MSGSKHFDKIAWTATALILAITILFMNGNSLGIKAAEHIMGYEKRLFDNARVHTLDIVMNNWEEFTEGAANEEYSAANVIIDGEVYKNVGIRCKGNTSLSTVSSMNSDRYSFKIEFDHYDSSLSYHGLDKLSLNNLIQDSTMMKDYLAYTMMNEFGVNSSLCSFVYITVNGKDWGLYLAVEGVEDAFLKRNYGSDSGELYKPDSMTFGGGRGNGKDFDMNEFMSNDNTSDSAAKTIPPTAGATDGFGEKTPGIAEPPGTAQKNPEKGGMPFEGGRGDFSFSLDEETLNAALENAFEKSGLDKSLLDGIDFGDFSIETIRSALSFLGEETAQKLIQEIMNKVFSERNSDRGENGGFGGKGSSDVKLQYTDDNIDSYTNIWNNAKTNITKADRERLIESLKMLSNNEQLEAVVDIEQVIRYFVVHNYVCNGDSYTGSMVHNYYLYEENGRLAMIPWDYNLAFGTFQGGNGQNTVNTPIDSPISGGSDDDRPMWGWILSDESYTELYHEYFSDFLNSVDIQGIINNAYNLIKPYVKKDPTAFYSYDEFEKGVETMRLFCRLRSESIEKQLSSGETKSNMNYADASELIPSDMGTMGGKGGFSGGIQGINSKEKADDKQPSENGSPDNIPPVNTAPPNETSETDTNIKKPSSAITNNKPSDSETSDAIVPPQQSKNTIDKPKSYA